jgi:diguanylate cyclase (GGDEF)-like protein/PAS domain S-box-containing protein
MNPESPSAPLPVSLSVLGPRAMLPSQRLKQWVGMAVLQGLLVTVLASVLMNERQHRLTQEQDRLAVQARVIEENLERQLQGVNAALSNLRYDLISADKGEATNKVALNLRVLTAAMPGVRGMLALDEKGNVMASDRPNAVLQNHVERDYFTVPRMAVNPSTLHVSAPMRSQQGEPMINIARVMVGESGKFAGVVTAALDTAYFEIVMRSVLYADDMGVRIVHGEGVIFQSVPPDEARFGVNQSAPDTVFSQHLDSRQTATVQMHGDRMVASHTLRPAALQMDFPLVVQVSRDTDAVLKPWRTNAIILSLFAAFAIGTTSLGLFFSQRRQRLQAIAQAHALAEQQAGAQRLAFALKGADLGMWEWDLVGRQMIQDAREQQMLGFGEVAGTLEDAQWRGMVHEDDKPLLRAAFENHAKGKTPAYSLEHRIRHNAGHWIWVWCHGMITERGPDGQPIRIVGTHMDISERKEVEIRLAQNAALLADANEKLSQLTLTDGLTGVGNRRHFDQSLAAQWATAQRQQSPLALLMLDIDHFKLYNDAYGHQGGDDCLRQVAQLLSASGVRTGEVLARYGGEEFAILLPYTDLQAAATVAQRYVDQINAAKLPHKGSPVSPFLTLSIGIASHVPTQNSSADELVKRADAALYRAKHAGRARYELAASEP